MKYITRKIEESIRNPVRSYQRQAYEEVAPISEPRQDFEGYSTIKINRVDRKGKYLEVILENAERYQRLWNPEKYVVLIDRVGNSKDYYATGKLVRKDVVIDTVDAPKGEVRVAIDNNTEVY